MDIAVFAPASMRVACADMWCNVVALRRLAAPCKLFFLSLGFSALVRTVCLAMSCGCLLCYFARPICPRQVGRYFSICCLPCHSKEAGNFFQCASSFVSACKVKISPQSIIHVYLWEIVIVEPRAPRCHVFSRMSPHVCRCCLSMANG